MQILDAMRQKDWWKTLDCKKEDLKLLVEQILNQNQYSGKNIPHNLPDIL
jgi:hypothetical protein